MKTGILAAITSLLVCLLGAEPAHAFCGFYVSGADQTLYNKATMVVLMRDGRRTVLSMQNDYHGPPENFALVVPVPEVLSEDDVKTLPRAIFDRVDQLAAPRLVEYWEQDPCAPFDQFGIGGLGLRGFGRGGGGTGQLEGSLGVTVEAEFSVGEYDVVVLSADDSSGLDTWLRQNEYNIPEGAEPVLRPYVAAGTKFFVAKVAVDRVTFDDGKAVLSPLRFHYDTDELTLPVRLGLLNSAGTQDLIVHVLAKSQRYEVANFPNAFIPTNIRVEGAVRHDFGSFYDLLFRRTVAANPGAVVTEYAWDAGSCDPCPVPALTGSELMTLGADVMSGPPPTGGGGTIGLGRGFGGSSWVLTRMHYRYGSEGLSEDLVFRAAPAIVGGRGMPDQAGNLGERVASQAPTNNFQGRYVMLNPFEGEIACESPRRGMWGGPPGEQRPSVFGAQNPALNPTALERSADAPADAPRVISLGLSVKEAITALSIEPGVAEDAMPADPGPPQGVEMPGAPPTEAAEAMPEEAEGAGAAPGAAAQADDGCGSCSAGDGSAPVGWVFAAMIALFVLRRRQRP